VCDLMGQRYARLLYLQYLSQYFLKIFFTQKKAVSITQTAS